MAEPSAKVEAALNASPQGHALRAEVAPLLAPGLWGEGLLWCVAENWARLDARRMEVAEDPEFMMRWEKQRWLLAHEAVRQLTPEQVEVATRLAAFMDL